MSIETTQDPPAYYDPALPAEVYYSGQGLAELYGPGRTIAVTVPSDIAITPQQAREFGAALIRLADYAEHLEAES